MRRLTSLPPDVLDLPDEELYDAVWHAVTHETEDITPAALRPYTASIRAFVATAMVDGEVGNGGWEQLFYNMTDEWLEPAVDGWRLFGSEAHVRLITDVRAAAASGEPVRDAARLAGTLDAFAETYETAGLEPLNERWVAIWDEGARLRLRHVRSTTDDYFESR